MTNIKQTDKEDQHDIGKCGKNEYDPVASHNEENRIDKQRKEE